MNRLKRLKGYGEDSFISRQKRDCTLLAQCATTFRPLLKIALSHSSSHALTRHTIQEHSLAFASGWVWATPRFGQRRVTVHGSRLRFIIDTVFVSSKEGISQQGWHGKSGWASRTARIRIQHTTTPPHSSAGFDEEWRVAPRHLALLLLLHVDLSVNQASVSYLHAFSSTVVEVTISFR